MKQNDILAVVMIVVIATLFSSIVASKVFNSSGKHNLTAPEVQTIDGTFPDIKNDTAYNGVFNSKALDPTQLIQIGTSSNTSTFTQ
jgi:hypothetical protein